MIFNLEPQDAPEPGAGTLGKPDEDAWNRSVRQIVRLRGHRASLEHVERRQVTEAMYRATPGFDDEAIATREAVYDLERWRGREEYARDTKIAAMKRDARRGEALILTARESAKSCQLRHAVVKCGCGARLVDAGCGRVDCVRCAPTVTKERARSVVNKLEGSLEQQRQAVKARTGSAPAPALFAFRVSVFTMPPVKREAFVTKTAHNRIRRALVQVLMRNFNAGWAGVTTHPVGDEDVNTFHPHFNVFWAKRGLARGFMREDELAQLKRWWAYLLEHDGRLPRQRRGHPKDAPLVMPEGPPPFPVDVHGKFVRLTDKAKIRHRARYYARVFVGWKFWIPKAVQWFGEYLRNVEAVNLCPCCSEAFTILRTGPGAVQLYLHLLTVAQERGQAPPAGAGLRRSPLFEAPTRAPEPASL